MFFTELNEENFLLFAIKNYENPQAVTKEDFDRDLNHFKYIKRLLKKYHETGVLKERLLLNHIIVINNLFGPDASVTLLLFKIQPEYWSALKSFLVFLNIAREDEINVSKDNYVSETLERLNG